MVSAFEKLTKILTLEQEQGYRNRAVIGGLEKFASYWQNEARQEALRPSSTSLSRSGQAEELDGARLVEEIVALLQSYPTLEDRGSREQVVEKVLSKLRQKPRKAEEEPTEEEEVVKPKEEQPRERPGLDSD